MMCHNGESYAAAQSALATCVVKVARGPGKTEGSHDVCLTKLRTKSRIAEAHGITRAYTWPMEFYFILWAAFHLLSIAIPTFSRVADQARLHAHTHCHALPLHCPGQGGRLVSRFLLPRLQPLSCDVSLVLFAMNLKGISIVDCDQFMGNGVQAHLHEIVSSNPGCLQYISIIWRKGVSWRTKLLLLCFLNFLCQQTLLCGWYASQTILEPRGCILNLLECTTVMCHSSCLTPRQFLPSLTRSLFTSWPTRSLRA